MVVPLECHWGPWSCHAGALGAEVIDNGSAELGGVEKKIAKIAFSGFNTEIFDK